MIINKELILSNRKKAVIVADLRSKDFRPFPKVAKAIVAGAVDEEEEEEDVDAEGGLDSDFDYLLSMSLSSLTAEKVAKLMAERDAKEDELTALLALSAADLWVRDLAQFDREWSVSAFESSTLMLVLISDLAQALLEGDMVAQAKSIKAAKGKGKAPRKKKMDSDDDDDSEEEFEYKPVKKAPVAKKAPIVKKVSLACRASTHAQR